MSTQKMLTPADRIRELSVINSDVAAMLKAAGQAVNALTNRPVTVSQENGDDMMDTTGNSEGNAVDAHKQVFQQSATAYYTNLQAVIARLRRQAYALEEAGIIVAAPTGPKVQAGAPAADPTKGPKPGEEPQSRITNGGLGNLDIGWLNSRGNKVGAEKEHELVQDAKELLERMLAEDDMAGT